MPMGMLQAFIDTNINKMSEESLKQNFHDIGHLMLSWVHPEEYESAEETVETSEQKEEVSEVANA